MYGLTPFERNFSVFDALDGFGKDFFGDTPEVRCCRTDIREEDDKFIMESELPGFNKEDIAIDINGRSLILHAEHTSENSDTDSKGKYIRRERSYGSYSRRFDISGIDQDKITADYKNGILTMTLPKKQPDNAPSRHIPLN